MRTARFLASAAIAVTASVLGLGAAAAQTATPTAEQVAAAKAALQQYTAAHAPKSESTPTTLDACPWGDSLVVGVASRQADSQAAATGTPTVSSSVFLDQTVDKGTRSIACTVPYTTTGGDQQSLTVVAYADPGLKTTAFAKALAKQTKGKLVAMNPSHPTLAGGKVEGYCMKYSSSTQCTYAWNRDGLYVEIDNDARAASNFTELHDVVPATVAALQSLKA